MKLVHNARRAWRWFSVQALTVQGAAAASWLAVPEDLRAAVPPAWLAGAALVLALLGLAGRLIDQGEGS